MNNIRAPRTIKKYAGRSLSQMVAVKVLGKKIISRGPRRPLIWTLSGKHYPCPSYTADLNIAIKLVAERQWNMETVGDMVSCKVFRDGQLTGFGLGHSPPTAICLALLDEAEHIGRQVTTTGDHSPNIQTV